MAVENLLRPRRARPRRPADEKKLPVRHGAQTPVDLVPAVQSLTLSGAHRRDASILNQATMSLRLSKGPQDTNLAFSRTLHEMVFISGSNCHFGLTLRTVKA
jgi:hypothetical protein